MCLAAAGLALTTGLARAEGPARDGSGMSAPPAEESGLLGAISRWIDESAATMQSQVKDARRSIDDVTGRAGDVAKDAAGTVARLPRPTVVTGRERCDTMSNGAPDCAGAVAALCRTGGFSTGQSLDIEAKRKCPVEALLSGRMAPHECPSQSHVTRALCH